jgi:hypothetical protein
MKEKLFVIWVIALVCELFWVSQITHNVHTNGDLFFSGVVVIVTIAIGGVGSVMFNQRN